MTDEKVLKLKALVQNLNSLDCEYAVALDIRRVNRVSFHVSFEFSFLSTLSLLRFSDFCQENNVICWIGGNRFHFE